MSSTACTPQPTIPQFQWKQCMELGYADGLDSNDDMADPICFYCGKEGSLSQPIESPSSSSAAIPVTTTKLSTCAKCQVVTYCSRSCQVTNWKKGADQDSGGNGGAHKFECSAYKRVGTDMILTYPDDKQSAREDFFHRVRFYASPYFVHRSRMAAGEHYPTSQQDKKQKGFLFIQSDSTLAEMSLPRPVLANGRVMTKPRSVLLHYLTVREYTEELCQDDFELVAVSGALQEAIDECDVDGSDMRTWKEYVVLMRFRCGHVTVGIVPLVPDYGLCVMLGEQYYGSGENAGGDSGAIQLNLDDL